MMSLYNTLTTALTPCVELYARWRRRQPEAALEWSQRMGLELPSVVDSPLWIHGASLGEARIIETIAQQLSSTTDPPLVVSALTSSGLAQLQSRPCGVAQFRFPLDLPGAVRRSLDRIAPAQVWLVETELWPNFITTASDQSVPVSIVNGRIAPEKMERYRRWSRLYQPILKTLHQIAAQSDADADRFMELGAPEGRVWVSGNMKFDIPLAEDRSQPLRQALGQKPLWIAGSTRPAEERRLLRCHRRLLEIEPNLELLLAPRHLDRLDEVAGTIEGEGFSAQRYSTLERETDRRAETGGRIWLLDSLGELAGLYGASAFAVVGGTLEPFGGHSPLEAASCGVPILAGPHTSHVEDSIALLEQAGAAQRVSNDDALFDAARRWLRQRGELDAAGAAAVRCVESHRGATASTIARLRSAAPS